MTITTRDRESVRWLADEINGLKKQVAGIANKPQLAHSSIEDGAVDEYDADGTLVSSIGRQFDGTHVAVSLAGPTPPTPTAPTVAPRIGGLTVRWNGAFVDADGATDILIVAPQDFSRVEVHASTDPAFTAEFADTLLGTIETPRGTDVPVSLPHGTYYVRLVTRTLSGKRGEASAVSSGVVVPITGTQLAADAIDGKTITGSVVRSRDSASRWGGWQLDDVGIRAWPPGDGTVTQSPTFFLDSATGNLIATGTFQTATSGARLRLANTNGRAAIDMFADTSPAHGAIYTSIAPSGQDETTIRHYIDTSTWSYQYAITPNSWIIGSPAGAMLRGVTDGATNYIESPSIFGREYTLSSNVYITANGIIGRSTSKRANKLAVEPASAEILEKILTLDPVTWFDRTESESVARLQDLIAKGKPTEDKAGRALVPTPAKLRRVPGLIAEDVQAAGLPEFVNHGEDDGVEGLMYERIGIMWIPAVRQLREENKALRAELDEIRQHLGLLPKSKGQAPA